MLPAVPKRKCGHLWPRRLSWTVLQKDFMQWILMLMPPAVPKRLLQCGHL